MSANPIPNPSPYDSTRPALGMVAITTSDTVEQTRLLRQIYVGTGGDVSLVDSEGTTTTHKNVSSGAYIGPFLVVKVRTTATTAADMVGYV